MSARIYEQVDVTAGKPNYCWMTSGIGYHGMAKNQKVWKWIRGAGCKGCWVTNDPMIAASAAQTLGIAIETNGTHAVHGVAGMLYNTGAIVRA